MGLAERLAVHRALTDRAADLAATVRATVVEQVPAYRTLTDGQLHEITAIAQWATTRLTELWAGGGRLTARDLNRLRGIGASRAVDGRPLPAVLRAYRVAAVTVTDAITRHAPPALTVDDMAAFTRTLVTALDDLSEAISAGHGSKATEDRPRLLEELVHDLVTGRQTSPGALADRTRRLGIRIPDRFGLLVTDPPLLEGLAAVRSGLGVALVLDGPAPSSEGRRACLLDGTSAAGLPRDFVLAATALAHGPADRPVLDRGDALTVAVLHGEPAVDRAALHAAVLGPLLDPANRHVLDGLGAYLRHGSATEAAAALGRHAQTMRSRLRRLTRLTGRRLDDPWDRLVLQLAHGSLMTRHLNIGR